jgi:hypothetical protein
MRLILPTAMPRLLPSIDSVVDDAVVEEANRRAAGRERPPVAA